MKNKNMLKNKEIPRRKIPYKARYKLFLVGVMIILTLILCVNLISADLTFDNSINFYKDIGNYGKYEVRDWFGLQKLQDVELKENTEFCNINCSAKKEISMHQKGVLIDDVKFLIRKNGKGEWKEGSIKDYRFFIIKDGFKILYELGTEVDKGNYIVLLEGKKSFLDDVDWQIKIGGKYWTEDWATWTSSLSTDLRAYWNFDKGTGIDVEDSVGNHDGTIIQDSNMNWKTGILGNATNFTLISDSSSTAAYVEIENPTGLLNNSMNFSVSLWVQVASIGTYRTWLSADGRHETGSTNLQISISSNTGRPALLMYDGSGNEFYIWTNNTIDTGTWQHLVFVYNGDADATTTKIYWNGTLAPVTIHKDLMSADGKVANNFSLGSAGGYYGFLGLLDEVGIWNRSLNASEVSDLYNSGVGLTYPGNVILNSPADNQKFPRGNVVFNCSVRGISLTNISLFHNETGTWHRNLTTIISGNSNETIFTVLISDTSLWNCRVCDSEGCSVGKNNRTIIVSNENSQTYSPETIEGSAEIFSINITYKTDDFSDLQGFLWYNETSYLGTHTTADDEAIFTTTIEIPAISNNINLSFFWEIVLFGTTTLRFNSTIYNQSVFNLSTDNCSTYNNIIYNFTIVDEENQDPISANNSIKALVNIYSFSRNTLISNYSGSVNTSSMSICTNRNLSNFNSTHLLDSTVKYSAQDHETEYYNVGNYSLTNQSGVQNIILYDLLTSDSTEFQLTFTGSDFLAVEDALVFVKRQYVDENVFKTVELPKTDSNGQTILHLVRNDIVYNMEVMKGGIVIGNFENIIAFCDDVVIGDCKISLSAGESGEAVFSYDDDVGITYTGPTYNNITRIITFNFLTTDGSVKNVLMNATRNDIFGNTSICSASIISSGGTLTCTVPSYIEDSTIITKIFVNGKETLKDYLVLSEFNYGKAGYFIFFVYMLAFILMFSKSKTTMLIGIMVGFIVGITLGLISGRLMGIGASGIWLIVVVILMIWKLNKERPN